MNKSNFVVIDRGRLKVLIGIIFSSHVIKASDDLEILYTLSSGFSQKTKCKISVFYF